ncbi:flippase [Salinivibrio sp. DV]|uniref:flippase n=1 Tax=Salinivibrio sp. SS2 TaxID=1892894 RepID=UPI00084C09EB|nr:flippase [Salinivibrio sp. DV]ODP99255.1 hypothetical protein BGK46_10845 [Salinivibrio sp. DV]
MLLLRKINELRNNKIFFKYAKNTVWLIADNATKLIVGLFVGVWVARHLGPEDFGIYSYAISFVAIFSGVATLGLDNIVVRELVDKEECREKIIATTYILKCLGAAFSLLLLFSILFYFDFSANTREISIIMAFSIAFQTLNVIKLYFQSVVKIKYFVISSVLSIVISGCVKIYLILSNAPLESFAKAFLLESFLLSGFLVVLYRLKSETKTKNYLFDLNLAKALMSDSWPLIFAAIASVVKLKLGHVMLGNLGTYEEVGYYSAALRISELWFLIPVLLGTSIYPALIKANKNGVDNLRDKVILITRTMLFFAVPFAIIVSFLSKFIIVLLYGKSFEIAGKYLSIQIWSGLPYIVLFAYSQVTYIIGKTKIHLYLSLLSIFSIAIFNYLLIPLMGGIGAVYASLITNTLGSCLMIFLLEREINIFTKGIRNV